METMVTAHFTLKIGMMMFVVVTVLGSGSRIFIKGAQKIMCAHAHHEREA